MLTTSFSTFTVLGTTTGTGMFSPQLLRSLIVRITSKNLKLGMLPFLEMTLINSDYPHFMINGFAHLILPEQGWCDEHM